MGSTSSLNNMGESFRNSERDDSEDYKAQLRVSSMTTEVKKKNERKKARGQRLCVKIMSDVDVINDGYKWRKYGQKVAKNTLHPRNYYHCTTKNCRVKKRIERSMEDSRIVMTSYEGTHNHARPFHENHLEGFKPQSMYLYHFFS